MLFSFTLATALLATGANAHFRLLYPEPRGPFVADIEDEFCGGYTDVTSNRTAFSLSDGFFRVRQGHGNWTASVLISTVPNPNTFAAFESEPTKFQFARHWANELKSGNFCIPLDLSNTGIAGVEDGANVTIQVTFAGGDGQLYQCADLTLSSNLTIPKADLDACKNETKTEDHSSGTGSNASPSAGTGGASEQDAANRNNIAGLGVALAGFASLLLLTL